MSTYLASERGCHIGSDGNGNDNGISDEDVHTLQFNLTDKLQRDDPDQGL